MLSIDEELVQLPVTYAGGARTLVRSQSEGLRNQMNTSRARGAAMCCWGGTRCCQSLTPGAPAPWCAFE